MASPFPPNATLTFLLRQEGSAEHIDEQGNALYETSPITVQAYLRKGDKQTTLDVSPDLDINKMSIQGRVVRVIDEQGNVSSSLDFDRIVPGSKATISINGLPESEFYLQYEVPSAFGVDDLLGQKIKGYIVYQAMWGTALV